MHVPMTACLAAALSLGQASGATIFSQIGSPANLLTSGPEGFFRYGSQIFPGEPQFDLMALDDFSIDGPASIQSCSTVMAGYGQFGSFDGVQGFELRIFASIQDAAIGSTAALVSRTLATPAGFGAYGTGVRFDFDLGEGFTLAAGHYWMSIQAINPGSNGQVGVVISDLGDDQSWQANPGGGFGVPGNLLQRPVNLAYELGGSVIPGPGALALVLVLPGRRRR